MAEHNGLHYGEDPFNWDSERLVKELYSSQPPWSPATPAKLPDRFTLSSAIRELDLDGESLLVYKDMFGSYDSLFADLGIKKIPHKIFFTKAINHLKSVSPAYKSFCKDTVLTNHSNQIEIDQKTLVTRLEAPEPPVAEPPTKKRKRIELTEITTTALERISEDEELRDTDSEYAFNSFSASGIPRGVSQSSNRGMKRFFRDSSTRWTTLTDERPFTSVVSQGSQVQHYDSGDNDPVLPLYGESDDDADPETLREVEEEEKEEAVRRSAKPAGLSEAEVAEIINIEMVNFVTRWEEKKLPKYESRAFEFWNQARRNGTRRQLIDESVGQLRTLCTRIDQILAELKNMSWNSHRDLRQQARCLDATVEDREYHNWVINTLNGVEPAKPTESAGLDMAKPRRHLGARNSLRVRKLEDDEEELTSSDEEDISNPLELEPDVSVSPPLAPSTDADFNNSRASQLVDDHPNSDHDMKDIIDLTHEDDGKGESSPTATDKGKGRAVFQLPTLGPDQSDILTHQLISMDKTLRGRLLQVMHEFSADKIWVNYVSLALRSKDCPPHEKVPPMGEWDEEIGFTAIRLFDGFISNDFPGPYKSGALEKATIERIQQHQIDFPTFYDAVRSAALLYFPPVTPVSCISEHESIMGDDLNNDDLSEDTADSDEDLSVEQTTQGRRVALDVEAKRLRAYHKRQAAEQMRRREALRQALSQSNDIPKEIARLIVNESKQQDQGLVYINQSIGAKILQHQVDGVRFLWNQIVDKSIERPGCLLAHTMGLGKTMQVITLLTTICDAAASSDPTVSCQIPDELKASKTLIMCPGGLADNWIDEFYTWEPRRANLFGVLAKINRDTPPSERARLIEYWAATQGVLVIGYEMFRSLAKSHPALGELMYEKTSLIVLDEAHVIKNQTSEIFTIANKFRTNYRIAMTGTPLSNHIEEYYNIINWFAPNFLGPFKEFKAVYVKPIKEGLFEESTREDRRIAHKKLAILGRLLVEKVNRVTLTKELRSRIPPKTEYLIQLGMTDLQKSFYKFIYENRNAIRSGVAAEVLGFLQVISYLQQSCAHPAIIHATLMTYFRNHPRTTHEMVRLYEKLGYLHMDVDELRKPSHSWRILCLLKIVEEAQRVGDKVLVFSQNLGSLDYLQSLLGSMRMRVLRLDGSTSVSVRQEMTRSFNKNNLFEIFLISTCAGGVGLNIQGANRVVLLDMKFNPAQELQAVCRAYRMGQTKPVFVYKFYCGGTSEEGLENQRRFKVQLASRVVDKEHKKAKCSKLKELIRPHREPQQSPIPSWAYNDVILNALMTDEAISSGIKSITRVDTYDDACESPDEYLTAEDRQEIEATVRSGQLGLGVSGVYVHEESSTASTALPGSSKLMHPSSQIARQNGGTTVRELLKDR
jgi:SNF2 family DNA or RNA helicase